MKKYGLDIKDYLKQLAEEDGKKYREIVSSEKGCVSEERFLQLLSKVFNRFTFDGFTCVRGNTMTCRFFTGQMFMLTAKEVKDGNFASENSAR